LRTLLLALVSGSPRMQTLAIRTLGKVLPLVSAFALREHSLHEYLVRADKNERFGEPTRAQTNLLGGGAPTTPVVGSGSTSSTPYSAALKQSSSDMPVPMDALSLGDAAPQVASLALSRSSSLQARQETDALLSAALDKDEQRLDQLEVGKIVQFLFKRLA